MINPFFSVEGIIYSCKDTDMILDIMKQQILATVRHYWTSALTVMMLFQKIILTILLELQLIIPKAYRSNLFLAVQMFLMKI